MESKIWSNEDIPVMPPAKARTIWGDDDILVAENPKTFTKENKPWYIEAPQEAAKGLTRGSAGVLDAPFALYDLGAMGSNWVSKKLGAKEPVAPILNFYPGQKLLKAFQQKTGINLEPNRNTALNRGIGTISEWAAPGGIFGKFGKTTKALQGAKSAAKLGAASAALQEIGIDPLDADITTIVGAATGKALGKTATTAAKRTAAAIKGTSPTDKAAQILRNEIGANELEKVTNALTNKNTPLKASLPTAEVAFNLAKGEKPNPGLSRLHRALAPNADVVTNKTLATNELLNQNLHNIGNPLITPTEIGDTVRNKLFKNYSELKNKRATQTAPLYEQMYLQKDKRIPEEAYKYIDQFYQPENLATGRVKSLFDYYNRNLFRTQTTGKPNLSKGDQFVEKLRNNASPEVRAQLDKMLPKTAATEGILSMPAKTPGEIENFIQHTIKPKMGIQARSGDNQSLKYSQQLKDLLEKDIGDIAYKQKYAELSKPINAIKDNDLLGNIIKQDIFKQGYTLPSDAIGQKILSASTDSTKELVKQLKGNKKAIEGVRSTYINHLFSGKENLTYDRIRGFNHKYREKLPQVFTKEQVKVLKDAEEILHRRHLVQNVGRAVGSNTQSETTLLNDLFNKAGNSAIKTLVNKIPGGKVLYSQTIENIAKNRELAVKEILGQALADPEFAATLLKRPQEISLPTMKEALQNISHNYVKDLSNPVGISRITKDREQD